MSWSLYETLLGNGVTADRREVAINESVNAFMAGMADDPAYQKNASINGVVTPMLASRSSAVLCKIKALPSTKVHIGDVVECLGEHWIVVEQYTDKVGIINGEMWLCNNVLRFQNHSVEINSRYCVVDDGTYSKKTSDPNAFVMANTYKIYITIDDATRKLFVDKRLALGQIYSATEEKILEVYKIIGMDVKSKNFGDGSHLMVLTLQRDVYDEHTDSLSENICDIIQAGDANASVSGQTGSCIITGKDTIRIGTSRKYTVTFTDGNGEILSDAVPVWTVSASEGVNYDTSATQCSVAIPLNEKYVGEIITLSVSDANNLLGSYEKKVRVIPIG